MMKVVQFHSTARSRQVGEEKNTRRKEWIRLKTGLYGWRNGQNKSDIELKNRLKNFDSNFKCVPKENVEDIPTIFTEWN